jgi:hypothetical protein
MIENKSEKIPVYTKRETRLIPLNAPSNGQELSEQSPIFVLGLVGIARSPRGLMGSIQFPFWEYTASPPCVPKKAAMIDQSARSQLPAQTPGRKLSIAHSILVRSGARLAGSAPFFTFHLLYFFQDLFQPFFRPLGGRHYKTSKRMKNK